MSITRSDAATYLHSQFVTLAREVGQTGTDDDIDGYGPDIDAALRRMDVAESDLASATVADTDRTAFYALCDYYCLSRMARRLTTRVDSGALVDEGNRQKVFENVKALLEGAAALLEQLGYSAGAGAGDGGTGSVPSIWGWVDFNTDWVEPGGGVPTLTGGELG
jgi:hypothetical protein